MVHLSSVNHFYVIFQVLSHCSFVILLTLHSLFLHYFCLIFSLLRESSAFDLHFPFHSVSCCHTQTLHTQKLLNIGSCPFQVLSSQLIVSRQHRFNQRYQLNRITFFPCQSGIQMEVFPSEQQSIVHIPFCHIPLLHISSHHKMYKGKWKPI